MEVMQLQVETVWSACSRQRGSGICLGTQQHLCLGYSCFKPVRAGTSYQCCGSEELKKRVRVRRRRPGCCCRRVWGRRQSGLSSQRACQASPVKSGDMQVQRRRRPGCCCRRVWARP